MTLEDVLKVANNNVVVRIIDKPIVKGGQYYDVGRI